jgi:purine-binding chemotaxis protein CheW
MGVGLHRDQLVVLVFEVEGHRYAIDTDSVHEIVRAVSLVRLPRAPRVITGVINVRGEVLPVLDLRARFGLPARSLRLSDVFVIVETQRRRWALRADGANELMRVPRASIALLRESVPRAEYLAGTAVLPDGLLLICDVELFLDEAERSTLELALAEQVEGAAP